MSKSNRYSPEVRERAVRLVREHQGQAFRRGRKQGIEGARRWFEVGATGGRPAQLGERAVGFAREQPLIELLRQLRPCRPDPVGLVVMRPWTKALDSLEIVLPVPGFQ